MYIGVVSGKASEALDALYAEVDQVVERLEQRHRGRLACRAGCSGCCHDGLTVFAVEADRIRARHPGLLAEAAPGPEGGCAFLDPEGRCRIYPDRPYVCRTQGLPLRWLDAAGERRDVCELNDADARPGGVELLELSAEDCFELGPFEGRLAALQAERQGVRPGSTLVREGLRGLFAAPERGRV